MTKPVVVTARIDGQLSADLDRLAAMRERSRAWLVEKAIAQFVREELEFRASLDEAEAEIERGDYLEHDEFMAELRAKFGRRQAA
jgi:predicted transcriptional regulator